MVPPLLVARHRAHCRPPQTASLPKAPSPESRWSADEDTVKLIIMIPCLNEEDTLPQVLSSMPRMIEGITDIETLIVDDGSTDDTVNVARRYGVTHILRMRHNMGLARATVFILKHAPPVIRRLLPTSRPGWARGIAFVDDDHFFGGSSSATISLINRKECRVEDQLRLEQGVEHSIFALISALLTLTALYMTSRALDIQIHFMTLMAAWGAVSLAGLFPISINGLGPREGILTAAVAGAGLNSEGGVALGLLWFFMQTATRLAAGLAWLTVLRRSRSEPLEAGS